MTKNPPNYVMPSMDWLDIHRASSNLLSIVISSKVFVKLLSAMTLCSDLCLPKGLPDNIEVYIWVHEQLCSIVYILALCSILQARADDQDIYIIKPHADFALDLPNHYWSGWSSVIHIFSLLHFLKCILAKLDLWSHYLINIEIYNIRLVSNNKSKITDLLHCGCPIFWK